MPVVDREALRRDYEAAALSVSAVARAHGVAPSTLRSWAERYQWRRAPNTIPQRVAPRAQPEGLSGLTTRLARVLERMIGQLEVQALESGADSERWGRALVTIVKCMQTMGELSAALKSSGDHDARSAGSGRVPAAERRATLERRLDQLLAAQREDALSRELE